MNLSRRLAAEFLGTFMLLAIVVGSGIMGERLAGGNVAIALLANSIATASGLIVIIYGFAEISGAHFNSAVTLTELYRRSIAPRDAAGYLVAQISGGILGVIAANLMFEMPAVAFSSKMRGGGAQLLSEFIATFGLFAAIRCGSRFRPELVGAMIACYIAAAYWFTASTSFANPAVTIARAFSESFAGISPSRIPAFVIVQIVAAFSATFFFNWLLREEAHD